MGVGEKELPCSRARAAAGSGALPAPAHTNSLCLNLIPTPSFQTGTSRSARRAGLKRAQRHNFSWRFASG
jgi:hypothetical protein